MSWKVIKQLNGAANEAIASGNTRGGYELKLCVVEEALNQFDITKDESWYKIAKRVYNETVKIKSHNSGKPRNTFKRKEDEISQNFIVTPKIGLNDIGGLSKSKETLKEAFEWPLRHRKLMETHGLVNVLKGCLLYGPPGCGKTMIVEALAKDMGVTLLMAYPQNLMVKWFGSSEKLIGKIFSDARDRSPSIIFIDEVDKILPRSSSSSVIPRVISVVLQEMDGATTHVNNQVVVAMGTNEPWAIKEAVLRPGRCDRIIYIPPPDFKARKEIFKIHCRSPRLASDVDFDRLGRITSPIDGWHFSGGDLMNICNTAKVMALRTEIEKRIPTPLGMKYFLEALGFQKPQISPDSLSKYEKWGKKHASFKDG